jgi:hypothetical protein
MVPEVLTRANRPKRREKRKEGRKVRREGWREERNRKKAIKIGH